MIFVAIGVLFFLLWGFSDRQEKKMEVAETPAEAVSHGSQAIFGTLLMIAVVLLAAVVLLGGIIGGLKP